MLRALSFPSVSLFLFLFIYFNKNPMHILNKLVMYV